MKTFLALVFLVGTALGQMLPAVSTAQTASQPAIALDASCTGNGTTNYLQCGAWSSTPASGDTITCNLVGVSPGQNLTGSAVDATNGWYANVYGTLTANTTTSWETTVVKENWDGSASVPILHYNLVPSTRATINCKAWKNVPTSKVLDPGAVNQTTTATVTNPTSGTAAAPTYDNSLVWAVMARSNSTAPSSGGGCWLPAGTLTVVGTGNVRQADEYCIQTTKTAVNGPFTGNTTSVATVDTQLAILPLGQAGGTKALTGWYLPLGAAGSAPTGTATATTLGGATSFLNSVNAQNASPFWQEQGATAKTYDTGFNPTATGHIMVQGVDHTWGDAGSSIKFAGATANGNGFSFQSKWVDTGQSYWMWMFYKVSSSGVTNNTFCDIAAIANNITTNTITLQPKYLTASGFNITLEETDSSANSITQSFGSLMDTDLRIGTHAANVNERYHQAIVQTKSGSTWSQSGSTMNFDILCGNTTGACANPPAAVATTTGTASSGSKTLTVANATGIVQGQVVIATGIPDPSQTGHPAWTRVDSISGTTVTLSQFTTASLSGTSVSFYTKPANLVVAIDCTVTAGSTAMSCTAPAIGTIAAGQSVGGKGILPGTVAAAVSGAGPISVTLSIPAQSTQVTGDGATFWTAASASRNVTIGKEGSCTFAVDQWVSDVVMDEAGTGAFNDPN